VSIPLNIIDHLFWRVPSSNKENRLANHFHQESKWLIAVFAYESKEIPQSASTSKDIDLGRKEFRMGFKDGTDDWFQWV